MKLTLRKKDAQLLHRALDLYTPLQPAVPEDWEARRDKLLIKLEDRYPSLVKGLTPPTPITQKKKTTKRSK